MTTQEMKAEKARRKAIKKRLRCRPADRGMTYVKQVPGWQDTTQEITLQINLKLRAYDLPKDVTLEALAEAIVTSLNNECDYQSHPAITALIGMMPNANYLAQNIIHDEMSKRYPRTILRSLFEQSPSGGGCVTSIDYNGRIAEMRVKNHPVSMHVGLEEVTITQPKKNHEPT